MIEQKCEKYTDFSNSLLFKNARDIIANIFHCKEKQDIFLSKGGDGLLCYL